MENATATPASPWLDVKAAADYLGIPVGTLRKRRSEGTGPAASKSGKYVKFHRDDLDAWWRSHAEVSS